MRCCVAVLLKNPNRFSATRAQALRAEQAVTQARRFQDLIVQNCQPVRGDFGWVWDQILEFLWDQGALWALLALLGPCQPLLCAFS